MGRPATFDHKEAIRRIKAGESAASLAREYGVPAGTIYGVLSRYGVSSGLRAQLRNSDVPGTTKPRGASMDHSTGLGRQKPLVGEDRYVQRDPCFRCGARGDYPCGHRRV